MRDVISLCPTSDLPNGKREVFDINNRWVAVFNVDNRYYAIDDLCTHDGNILTEDQRGNPVPLDGYEIACPRHGARFDIRTGKVLSAPAYQDIRWYEVFVEEDWVKLVVETP